MHIIQVGAAGLQWRKEVIVLVHFAAESLSTFQCRANVLFLLNPGTRTGELTGLEASSRCCHRVMREEAHRRGKIGAIETLQVEFVNDGIFYSVAKAAEDECTGGINCFKCVCVVGVTTGGGDLKYRERSRVTCILRQL